MKTWSHLPNAHLIDWVLSSVKENPDIWVMARHAAYIAIRNAAWDAARDEARNAAWDAARDEARGMARNAARDEARGMARHAAWDAILALIAYDDCDQYLDMTYDQLLTYALLSEKPAAVLLLPLKWVQENECLVTPS